MRGLTRAALACLPMLSLAVVPADRVTSLPGWSAELPSEHYSGYLPVGKLSGSAGQLHYWLQMSEKDAATDPVVMWLNGGPGASGIIGMLTELGQLQTIPSPGEEIPAPQKKGEAPKLFHNKYGWTKVASLFTIEQPKGVGFSYCEGSGKCKNTDESTAMDTYEGIVAFFKAYPELSKRPFYITGESYAGVYIPMIIEQIDLHKGVPNFAGAAIGNGCWGSDCFYGVTESQIDYHTFVGQDFMSPKLAKQIAEKCAGKWLNVTQSNGPCGGESAARRSPDNTEGACLDALQEMCKQVGNDDINVYNMYDTCFPNNGLSLAEVRERLRGEHVEIKRWPDSLRTHPALHLRPAAASSAAPLGQLNDYACGSETLMGAWLGNKAVQAALHVKSDGGGMSYKQTAGDLRPLYAKLIPKHRMLIYSGNVDACVPTWGSEFWTSEIGNKYGIERDWHPWTSGSATPGSSKKVLAGYAMTYKVNNFTFATVKGAGHEVPRYKPRFALTLLEKFLAGEQI